MVDTDGASVRVMAGASAGTDGPIKLRNPGLLLDVRLAPGAVWQQVGWWAACVGAFLACCVSGALSPCGPTSA